jgi:hypothetical protein
MNKISELRAAIIEALDAKALTYGEETELTESEMNQVSYSVDDSNETWNPNLPPRPTN